MKRINWVNTLFLITNPLIAIVGTTLWVVYGYFNFATVILAVSLFVMSGISIAAGYHRLMAHKAYKTGGVMKFLYLTLGSASVEGSALEWCTDHRRHHRYVDTEKDPYNINEGFWHAHMGWLITLDRSKRDFSNVEDLMADPLTHWQHRFFVPIAIFMGYILPVAIAMLWGDPLGGFVVAGAFRIFFMQQATFCINSVCHVFGKEKYTDQQTAKDNWFTALFTFGEGFHNFHHQFALDYRNGIKYYHFDPAKWLIKGLSYFGITYDLKTVSDAKILRYKARLDVASMKDGKLSQHFQPLYDRITQMFSQIESLEKEYLDLKKMRAYGDKFKQCRGQLKEAYGDLRVSVAEWQALIKSRLQPSVSEA